MRAFCRDERLAVAEASRHGRTVGLDDDADPRRSTQKPLDGPPGTVQKPIPVVYRMADFCPCPRGDSVSDSRIYDAIRAGCIPVRDP